MPLVNYSLRIMKETLDKIDADPLKTGRVLTLAIPDVVASIATVTEIFGDRVRGVALRSDSDATINWHKARAITDKIVDTKALFLALGYQMDAVDQVEGRGGEIIHDLNRPLAWEFDNQYDFVFDCISNQVFTVGMCWSNMITACRVGGYVLSVTPMQMVNQGFWNVSPAAYYDFCAANDMELEYKAVCGVYGNKGYVPVDPVIRQRNIPDDTMNVALMRKTKHREFKDIVYPNMTKFKKYPTCQIPTKS